MKPLFLLSLLSLALTTSSHASVPPTADEKAFIANLKLDVPGNLERVTCHIDMTHIKPKALRWKGKITAFHDRYILPAEEKRLDRIATKVFSVPTGRPRTGAYPTGANPYLDEACVLSAFPANTYSDRTVTDDPIMAYLQALYLFQTTGCDANATIQQDFALASNDHWEMRNGPNPEDHYTQYRVPYAGYLASIITLKCTGDIDGASQQAQQALSRMRNAMPPPVPLPGKAYDRLYLWR